MSPHFWLKQCLEETCSAAIHVLRLLQCLLREFFGPFTDFLIVSRVDQSGTCILETCRFELLYKETQGSAEEKTHFILIPNAAEKAQSKRVQMVLQCFIFQMRLLDFL